eukprot:CAMPEP_0119052672 /NCGR_PEP_ID=MMETSP1177-20130426/73890_1 /TAXON_ID=2985 /ORGANISM="Ochromonas sp, Strain CCMP1899" /LENGTH=453 /DNA_ID=CAMNT_0007032313 /DNA_START=1381 /DNA_END=2742 /DNA_ORIENTATION=-
MNATCKFMVSSINRSQDFMKASNNIVLMPTLESFDLGATMAVAVTCIKHMLSKRLIVVHPFDENICPHLVSDKHWLTENMMCLLSNAIKYGDTGDVDVHIKVIGAPTYDNVLSSLKKDDHHEKEDGYHNIETRATTQPSTQPSMQPRSHTSNKPSSQPSSHRSVTCKRGSSHDTYPSGNDTKKPMVLITVEDSGIGICEEGRKNLFQPFKTAQRMAGGTGLGLYSLLKRVEALEGEAGVTSRNDLKQGSMFWFTFPYRPDEEAAKGAESPDGTGDGHAIEIESQRQDSEPVPQRRILLIDDSPSVLRVTSRFLLMNGHTVTTAPNGCAGLEILKASYAMQPFDLVMTDMQMPVMDGIEATSRFRVFEGKQMEEEGYSGFKRLLILGMSANSDDETKQEAINAGVDLFLTKPFTYKALRHTLDSKFSIEPISSLSSTEGILADVNSDDSPVHAT